MILTMSILNASLLFYEYCFLPRIVVLLFEVIVLSVLY